MGSATENRLINLYINGRQAGQTLSDVRKRYRRLSAEINRGKLTQKEYNDKVKELRRYGQILDDHRNKVRGISKSWSTFKGVAAGVVGGNLILTAFRKLTEFIPKMVQRNAELADSFADVRKTTDLTEGGVRDLYDSLKTFDTRTSREELLELARDAGKLGIRGAKNIAGFVKSADMINVSLGEDLGEGAVKNLGKLNNLFATSTIYGYEQGLQKLGSVINELGANSEAAEGAIVDFTSRLAGVATQADLTFAQVAGIGSTLDSLGQRTETSATAISQAIVGMFKDTEAYAEIAGMSVKDFTELMEKDANAAFTVFLEGLNGNNDGLAKMSARFDSLGIDGSRAITVLGALAGNTKLLKEQQDLANRSFDEGISLQKEFAIKNRNMAGNLEKIGKSLTGMWVNSGFLKGLEKAVGWFEKIVRLPVDRELRNQRVAANGLVTEIIKLNKGNQERVEKIRQLKKDYPALTGHIDEEKASNTELLGVLREINAEYVKKILLAHAEEDLADIGDDLSDALLDENAALDEVYKQRMELLQGATDEQREIFIRNEDQIVDYFRRVQEAIKSSAGQSVKMQSQLKKFGLGGLDAGELKRLDLALREYEGLLEKRENIEAEFNAKIANINKIANRMKTGSVGLGTAEDTETAETEEPTVDESAGEEEGGLYARQLALIKQAAEEEKLYLEQHRAEGLISAEQFEEEMLGIKLTYLLLQKEAALKAGEDTVSIEREMAQTEIRLMEMVNEAREKSAEVAEKAGQAEEDAAKRKTEAQQRAAEAAVESTAMRAAAAVEGAETEYEAAVGVINVIRATIKEYVLQAVAGAVAKEVASKGLLGLVTGAIAAGAVSLLFDKLIPPMQPPEKPKLAEGSAFWGGGDAIVGDEGREELNLPYGASVTPADLTQQMLAAKAFRRPTPQPNFSVINDGLTYSQSQQQKASSADAGGAAGVDLSPLIGEMRAMREDLRRAQSKDVVFSYRNYLEFKKKHEESAARVKMGK